MKKIGLLILSVIVISTFTSCGNNSHVNTTITAVDGYIKNATLKDSTGLIATYSLNGQYRFTSSPVYPLTLSGGILEDTNVSFDINMSAQNGSTVISPITTFLDNDSMLLSKFANLGLNKSTLEEFSIDYIKSNDIELSKLSQLLYTILRDNNLTLTFKQSIENNRSLDSLYKLFTIAQTDINSSLTLGTEEKIESNSILSKVKIFSAEALKLENQVKGAKENLAFVSKHGNPFITVWSTSSVDSNITIPIDNNYTYNYTVDWGDGNIEKNITTSATHIYRLAGSHRVKIYGDFPAIRFNNSDWSNKNAKAIKNLIAWGDIKWKSMNSAFKGCYTLTLNTLDSPDLSNVTDMSSMFKYASSYSFGTDWWADNNWDISNWDVSNITNMSSMFQNIQLRFNHDISDWNVSNVTNMNSMFYSVEKFNQDISSWKVSNVKSMKNMFQSARSFNQDISSWDVSNVTNMFRMFRGTTDFNQDISNWDVSNVTDMNLMFYNAENFNQDIRNWDVSSVRDMNFMFYGTFSFTNQDLSDWNVSNVTEHDGFFEETSTANIEPNWR